MDEREQRLGQEDGHEREREPGQGALDSSSTTLNTLRATLIITGDRWPVSRLMPPTYHTYTNLHKPQYVASLLSRLLDVTCLGQAGSCGNVDGHRSAAALPVASASPDAPGLISGPPGSATAGPRCLRRRRAS
jgi:hypothetical protein